MSESVHERLTQRPAAEKLEFYRAWADGNARLPCRDRAPGTEWIADLVAEIDAVTRERDEATAQRDEALLTLAEWRTDLGPLVALHRNGDLTAADRCAACGGEFDVMESRLYVGGPEGWVIKQARWGPLHSRCQRWPAAYQDALERVLGARRYDETIPLGFHDGDAGGEP